MPVLPATPFLAPAPPPGSSVEEWAEHSEDVARLLASDDVAFFLQDPVIRGTMFACDPDLADIELASLQARTDFASRWVPALSEHPLGAPDLLQQYPLTSANRLHKAHALAVLEDTVERRVSEFSSYFEFGPGYGATLSIARALGFEGHAHLYDLPPFSALQVWYLANLGITGLSPYRAGSKAEEQAFASALAAREPTSLFVSTWAISEAPTGVRDWIIGNLGHGYILIAYQPSFAGTDNDSYFDSQVDGIASHTWVRRPVAGLEGHSYLIGTPRSA